MEILHRFEAIARSNDNLEVRATYEGDGDLYCNVVSFADRHESEHEGLFATITYWKSTGCDLQLQVAACRWKPEPPTYETYVTAAKRLLGPIIRAYNRQFKTRHRMRIETCDNLRPKLKPTAKQAFDRFVTKANKKALHPLDWKSFYRFIKVCHRTGNYLNEDDIRWLCRRTGFAPDEVEMLQGAYFHCYHFLDCLGH